MRGSSHGRLLLELAIVRVARLEDLAALGTLVERLTVLESGPMPPRRLETGTGPSQAQLAGNRPWCGRQGDAGRVAGEGPGSGGPCRYSGAVVRTESGAGGPGRRSPPTRAGHGNHRTGCAGDRGPAGTCGTSAERPGNARGAQ